MPRPLLLAIAFLVPVMAEGQTRDPSIAHQRWSLSDKPAVEIGTYDGQGADVFGRVIGVVRTEDGHIAIAEGIDRELRIFDSAGRHIATSGRMGEGPGEFRTMRPPMHCGADSVYVWDRSLGRVSVFSSDGAYGRSFGDSALRTDRTGWSAWKMACNQEGSIATLVRNLGSLRPEKEGPVRVEMRVEVVSSEGGETTDLGQYPGDDLYFTQGNLVPRPLGKTTLMAVGSDRVYVGTGEEFEISVFSIGGQRVGSIREDIERVALDRTRRKAFIDATVEASRNGERSRRFYERLEYPELLPVYSNLLVDAEDNLWVQEYPDPSSEQGSLWRVYSRDGALLSLVETPRGFEVFDVGADYVIGVARDELGVEFVRMYRLSKGNSAYNSNGIQPVVDVIEAVKP